MKQKAVLYSEISGETEKASQKHTPGPWVIHEAGTYRYPEVIIPNGREVIAAAINGKANARLIAAAPDLLEACKASPAYGVEPRAMAALNAKLRTYVWHSTTADS